MQELSHPTVTYHFIWEEVCVVLLCSFFFLQPSNFCPWDHGCKCWGGTQGTVVEHPKSSREKAGQDVMASMEEKGRTINREGRGM